jgi:hypothetical protein
MTSDLVPLQPAYAAKRTDTTGAATMEIRIYRVTLADGREVFERVVSLSQVAAAWPDAKTVEWVGETEKKNFW